MHGILTLYTLLFLFKAYFEEKNPIASGLMSIRLYTFFNRMSPLFSDLAIILNLIIIFKLNR